MTVDAVLPAAELSATMAQDGQWQGFPPAAAQLAMTAGTLRGLFAGLAGAFFIGWPLQVLSPSLSWASALALMLGWLLLSVGLGIWLGYRGWKFSAWKLDGAGLHVKRGQFWRKEILVPLSRVQHLDIERGPIARHLGLATLVVHTAGTRQHALRQSGFSDADAVALRDTLVPASDRHDDVL